MKPVRQECIRGNEKPCGYLKNLKATIMWEILVWLSYASQLNIYIYKTIFWIPNKQLVLSYSCCFGYHTSWLVHPLQHLAPILFGNQMIGTISIAVDNNLPSL